MHANLQGGKALFRRVKYLNYMEIFARKNFNAFWPLQRQSRVL
jgi:hypothetical protein